MLEKENKMHAAIASVHNYGSFHLTEQPYSALYPTKRINKFHRVLQSTSYQPSEGGIPSYMLLTNAADHSSFPSTLSKLRRCLAPSHTLQVHQFWWTERQSARLRRGTCVRACAACWRPALSATCLTFPRNWVSSSHCQVCLILSCLTSRYLKSHLPKLLNPLVTHDNKKLETCSLNEDGVVRLWWGMEIGAQVLGCELWASWHSGVFRSYFFCYYQDEFNKYI